jgi:hypothetical protein
MTETTLTEIWHGATIATGCIADAIKSRGKNPKADVRGDLVEAAEKLAKAALEIRQVLAAR